MSKPRAPTPPSPQATAAAQTESNVNTAIANAQLNNVNQVTPWGSVTYSSTPGANGIPNWTQTTTLSENQQALNDLQEQQGLALGQLGLDQTERASDILSQPYSSTRADIAGSLGQANFGDQVGQVNYNGLGSGQVDYSGNAFNDMADPRRNQVGQADYSQYQLGSMDLASALGGSANFGPQIGNVQSHEVNGQRINNRLDLGNYNQAGLQNLDLSQYDSANAGQLQSYLYNLAAKPLESEFAKREESLRTRLANQGVNAGSSAFGSELSAFNEGAGNAYASAQLNAFDSALRANAQDANLRMAERGDLLGRMSNDAGLRTTEGGFNRDTDTFNANMSMQAQLANQAARQSADQQNFQRWGANADLAQAERGQQLSELLAQQGINMEGAQFNAGLAQQADTQNLARAGFNAGLDQTYNDQRLSQLGFNAGLAQSADAQNFARDQFNAGLAQQTDAANLTRSAYNADLAQNERAQQLAELLEQNSLDNQYDLADRQNPLNEIIALMSGVQTNPINPGQPNAYNIANTDVAGIINQGYQNQLGAYNAQMNAQGGLLGSLANLGAAGITRYSDRRLKRNIEYSHSDANGLRWYHYDYVWGGPRQLGVMADEAPAHAVSIDPHSGFAMVHYGLL